MGNPGKIPPCEATRSNGALIALASHRMKENIHCPRCGHGDELDLDTARMPLVIICPECEGTFLAHGHRSYMLESERVKHLLRDRDPVRFNEYVQEVIHSAGTRLAETGSGKSWKAVPREGAITSDDIADLRIELSKVESIDQLLELMG